MDFRILGFGVFLLIVLSGGAVIPLLGFSAVVYLVVFLVCAAGDARRGLDRTDGAVSARADEPR